MYNTMGDIVQLKRKRDNTFGTSLMTNEDYDLTFTITCMHLETCTRYVSKSVQHSLLPRKRCDEHGFGILKALRELSSSTHPWPPSDAGDVKQVSMSP